MYKVFFKESCFLLTDNRNLLQEGTDGRTHRDLAATRDFIFQTLSRHTPFQAVLYHEDPEALLTVFKSCFTYVKAAGGAVIRNSDVLLIKRLGLFDLPKGHLEAGETIGQCAVREVEEECGLRQVSVTAPLDATYHIYERDGKWFLKKTYWYRMSAAPGQTPVPQTEEGITEAFWYPLSGLAGIAGQAFPSLRDIFRKLQEEA